MSFLGGELNIFTSLFDTKQYISLLRYCGSRRASVAHLAYLLDRPAGFSSCSYHHVLSEDRSALSVGTSGYRTLTTLHSSDSKWNMVNKWSDITMAASIEMKGSLCSVFSGDLQCINNESRVKYFIVQCETHLIRPTPSTIARYKAVLLSWYFWFIMIFHFDFLK